jgi:predicted nuclease of predicted toxin-antitoxin system
LIRFLVDANLPPNLAEILVKLGHWAEHVENLGLLTAEDGTIWDYAATNDMVVITRDKDFAQRRAVSKAGPHIVWIRLPNTRRSDLGRWFAAILPSILSALESDETVIEVV